MTRLSSRERREVKELATELETIDLNGASAVKGILGALRAMCEVETIVCASPVERVQGWALERFDCDGSANDARFRRLLTEFLADAPRRFGWFDPVVPEVEQRDVVFELNRRIPRDEVLASPLCQRVLMPMRLHDRVVERILLTQDGALLGWFGVLHDASLTERQRELWTSIVPALRRRLGMERQLANAPLHAAALDTVLAQIGVPALIVDANGRVREANGPARLLLENRRADVDASLEAILAGRPAALPFDLTPLRSHGAQSEWLALLHPRTPEARLARTVAMAAARLGLTRRQADVLDGIIRGESNLEIAERLGVTPRAVEQHLSALFSRAGVETRSALVSVVLLAA